MKKEKILVEKKKNGGEGTSSGRRRSLFCVLSRARRVRCHLRLVMFPSADAAVSIYIGKQQQTGRAVEGGWEHGGIKINEADSQNKLV